MKGSTYDNHTSTNEVSMCVWKQHMGWAASVLQKLLYMGQCRYIATAST